MNIAMILAGGTGTRVGAGVPKQFIEVQGKPIIVHTLEAFQNCSEIDAIQVVCIASYIDVLNSLVEQYGLTKVHYVVPGGSTYQGSVINGLDALGAVCKPDDIVAIHFAAGAFVTEDIIVDSIRVAQEHGNGISSDPVVLCLAEKDAADNDRSSVVGRDRDRVMGLNSPQTFRYQVLRELYDQGARQNIFERIDPHTTSLMAALGVRLYFSKGSSLNIKITSPEDVELFNAYLIAKATKTGAPADSAR